ncbi:hypothetical protein PR048_023547 [Dryococelus australis]|uniref:Uncharacterized protein n=1 Tax=Dryococelus australis TaxID=614101 RepID=A0ABQ9GUC8_9NEOP|nr:hypothetical protein PR048_023547 [Dryococelus australis]
MKQRHISRAGEMGDPRENPLIRDIVQHDSQMRKFGSDPSLEGGAGVVCESAVARGSVRRVNYMQILGVTPSKIQQVPPQYKATFPPLNHSDNGLCNQAKSLVDLRNSLVKVNAVRLTLYVTDSAVPEGKSITKSCPGCSPRTKMIRVQFPMDHSRFPYAIIMEEFVVGRRTSPVYFSFSHNCISLQFRKYFSHHPWSAEYASSLGILVAGESPTNYLCLNVSVRIFVYGVCPALTVCPFVLSKTLQYAKTERRVGTNLGGSKVPLRERGAISRNLTEHVDDKVKALVKAPEDTIRIVHEVNAFGAQLYAIEAAENPLFNELLQAEEPFPDNF